MEHPQSGFTRWFDTLTEGRDRMSASVATSRTLSFEPVLKVRWVCRGRAMYDKHTAVTFQPLSAEAFSALVERYQQPLHAFLRGFVENGE
jgi:hypothetical protein